MKVIAINGSPRKNCNTAALLAKALEGAAAKGADTEIIHLYDLDFKGCHSCFACKRIGGKSYGKCAVKDGITPVLEKVAQADAVNFGSPIYIGNVSGEMRSFLERLMFPYLVYDGRYTSIAPKKLRTAFIYTMNVDENRMKTMNYAGMLGIVENFLERTFGSNETFHSNDTFQFDDYSKYESSGFDAAAKAKRRNEQFPKDCENARALGGRMAEA